MKLSDEEEEVEVYHRCEDHNHHNDQNNESSWCWKFFDQWRSHLMSKGSNDPT